MVSARRSLALFTPLAVTFALFTANPDSAPAQGFLQRLEQRVQDVINDASVRVEAPAELPQRSGSGYLGLTAEEDPQTNTLVVASVKPGSPAQKAGLKVDDQLLSLDGLAIDTVEQMAQLLDSRAAGARVTFQVLRNGQREKLTAVLAARDSERASAPRAATRTPTASGAAGGESAGTSSVLRRLERKVESEGRTDGTPPSSRDVDDAGVAEELARLNAIVERLERRVAQLEALLEAREPAGELPEPRP
ncbi:MAG: PDZ domain-containing protein [Pirellulales bacterium]